VTFSFTSGRVLLRAGQSAGEGLRVSSALFRYRHYRFISFDDFPWFRSATIDQLFEVALFQEAHL